MAEVVVKSVTKSFGAQHVLHDVSAQFDSGGFSVLVGPSGCGKTTLLRLVAGLEHADAGDIHIAGRRVNGLSPAQRRIAMVFQSYALYPHMTVYRNMAFGLKLAGASRDEVDVRVREAARILQLEGLLQRKPAQLSGGQRQRVAIGRAIVREPDVFLFDEPLSNLDAGLRASTRIELARLHAMLGATTIYVTHDQMEAMTLADRIVVMNHGRIEQAGAPLDVYRRPANLFVAGFIGHPAMNFLEGAQAEQRGATTIGIRPQHIGIERRNQGLSGRVLVTENLGNEAFVHVAVDQGPVLVVTVAPDAAPGPGDDVFLSLDDRYIHRFDQDGVAV